SSGVRLLKWFKERLLLTTFEAASEAQHARVVRERATQLAGAAGACVVTNLPHRGKHPASLRQCSRLMQHLTKLREQILLRRLQPSPHSLHSWQTRQLRP